jgi:hypothetical protein
MGRQASMRGRGRDDDHDAGAALVQWISRNDDRRPAAGLLAPCWRPRVAAAPG